MSKFYQKLRIPTVWFDKEQIGVKEPFPGTNFFIRIRNIRNNFRETKKFLIAKLDCTFLASYLMDMIDSPWDRC